MAKQASGRMKKQNQHCAFCDKAVLKRACSTARGKGSISRCLKKFHAFRTERPDIYEEAMKRIQLWVPELKNYFVKRSQDPVRPKPKTSRAKKQEAIKTKNAASWEAAKARRQRMTAPPTDQEKLAYRAAVLDDQRRVKRKYFGKDVDRRKRARRDEMLEVTDNGTGLPLSLIHI